MFEDHEIVTFKKERPNIDEDKALVETMDPEAQLEYVQSKLRSIEAGIVNGDFERDQEIHDYIDYLKDLEENLKHSHMAA
jgi:hypothetical protein